jgi:hypothetical protein
MLADPAIKSVAELPKEIRPEFHFGASIRCTHSVPGIFPSLETVEALFARNGAKL